jgi:hypothetical protein
MRAPRLLIVATILPLLTCLLYLAGSASTPPAKTYMWMHALNTGDPYAYLSWVEQARQGAPLFRVLFTEEPSRPLLFHPLFLAMGLVARITGLAPIAIYHLFRVALGMALIVLLHRFFARRLLARGAAMFALLYAVLGSGLGWVFARPDVPALEHPVDLWMPEAILFVTLLESPLNLAALAMALLLYERLGPAGNDDDRRGVARPIVETALLTLLLGLTHPFEIVSIAATLALTALLAGARFLARGALASAVSANAAAAARDASPRAGLPRARLAAFAAAAAVTAAYIQVVLRGDPTFAHWLSSARSPSPAPLMYVLAFAPQLALALLAVPRRWAAGRPSDLLPIAWVLATALLLYAPLAQQRRFVAGVQIPLTLLAAEGLFETLPRWAHRLRFPAGILAPMRRRRALLLALFLAASFGTNALVVGADIAYFRLGQYPIYLERDVVAAIAAFAERAPQGALLLASPEISHFVPALSGRRATMGHYDMTIDPERKHERLRRLLDPARSIDEKRAMLTQPGITHVLLSPYEASFADRDPSPLANDPLALILPAPAHGTNAKGPGVERLGLEPVFRSGPVWLFEVKH